MAYDLHRSVIARIIHQMCIRDRTESEYSINNTLGYISFKTQLGSDDVVGVAYEYTYNGCLLYTSIIMTHTSVIMKYGLMFSCKITAKF